VKNLDVPAVLLALSMTVALPACSNTLAFGTATKFGLDISQRPDQIIDVTMGYDRYEVVSIPAQNVDAKKDADTYSVLGIFSVSYGSPWAEPLVLRQFFATGWAARNAGGDARFQTFFGRKSGEILQQSEKEIQTQRMKRESR
jgi:hypothetical protein